MLHDPIMRKAMRDRVERRAWLPSSFPLPFPLLLLLLLLAPLLLLGAGAGVAGCQKTKGPGLKRALDWRQKVVRIFPADVNGDGTEELMVIHRTPDGKRSLMDAIDIGTGKRLWEQRTVACWEPSGLFYGRRVAVGRSHLLVSATIGGPEGRGGKTAVALHRLRDGKRLWIRQLSGEVSSPSPILQLHGPWAVVSLFQTSSKNHRSKLHVIRVRDGSQQCSVMLGAVLRNPALVGSWLLLGETDAVGPPSQLLIASLKDCTRRIAGTLAAGGGTSFSHGGRMFAILRKGKRLTGLSLRRFDPRNGRLVALEPHAQLFSRGLTGINTTAHASGMLRAHAAGDGAQSHRIALYAWPPRKILHWSLPIPKPASRALTYDYSASTVLQRPWTGATPAQYADARVRFLPVVLTHQDPLGRPAGRRRLALLDLQRGSLSWTSRPILTVDAPWGRMPTKNGDSGRAGNLYVIRFRPGGKDVPGLLWFIDGRTGKTLTVLDGSLPFRRWQIRGDRLYGLLPGASQERGGAPYVFDLRRQRLLFGSVPTDRFSSQRQRLEAEVGPLP